MIQNIKGTKDILPTETRRWQELESVVRSVTDRFGYDEIRTPIIEYSELFHRSAGEGSDVVNKEMYVFEDRSHDSICLRPELTAAVARVVLQNTLLRSNPTMRLWYYGPCFRYERPQLGRQRQFHQVGAEVIGSPYAEADADIIHLAFTLLHECGIDDVQLEINSIGSADARARYRTALVEYFTQFKEKLSEDSKRRLDTNPLRILDSKEEGDRHIVSGAPVIKNFLDQASIEHFERVLDLLKQLKVPFTVNPFLVRGLDYYTDTVFEFKTQKLGAQDAVGGGGRYNNLFESLQGPAAPGVGFGIGVERLLLLTADQPASAAAFSVYVAGEDTYMEQVVNLVSDLRSRGLRCVYDIQHKSLKAQMKDANRLNSSVVVFIGESEIIAKQLTIKDMNTGDQWSVPQDIEAVTAQIQAIRVGKS
ncbi:MAG: histidine--tRNA ligase [Candidatus Kapaibacterium sp.]